ncbi:hypothetical protein QQP08_000746 [Theobroma cacao]|nr:hypothetical protein QQP08_000746 [Theobroma cacao]
MNYMFPPVMQPHVAKLEVILVDSLQLQKTSCANLLWTNSDLEEYHAEDLFRSVLSSKSVKFTTFGFYGEQIAVPNLKHLQQSAPCKFHASLRLHKLC